MSIAIRKRKPMAHKLMIIKKMVKCPKITWECNEFQAKYYVHLQYIRYYTNYFLRYTTFAERLNYAIFIAKLMSGLILSVNIHRDQTITETEIYRTMCEKEWNYKYIIQ